MGEILYEKHCPPIPEVNYEETLNSRPAFESVFKSVLDSAGNCAMVPIPGKEKLAPLFVRLVQGAAELCLADVRVTHWETAVYAEFLYPEGFGDFTPLGDIMALADAARVFCVKEGVMLRLELYTHELSRRRPPFPEWEK